MSTSANEANLPFAPGVFAALVTPFTADDALDEPAFRALIKSIIGEVDGLVTSGTTGEFPYLAPEERRRLVEIAVEEAKGKPVVAGAGAPSTREAIRLARDAKQAGASACLVVTPYYLHPSDKGLYQHFYDLASAVDLPIILYNIPQLTGAPLARTVIEDLADLDRIVALKDSSGDLSYTLEVLEAVKGRIDVLVGHDEIAMPALSAGCAGMVLGGANVVPGVWQQVSRAVRQGDLVTARAWQRKVQKLSRIFMRHGGPVAVKAALNMKGVRVGRPRRPLKAVGGALLHETRAEIGLELDKLGMRKGRGRTASAYTPPGDPVERFGQVGLTAESIRAAGLRVGTGSAGEVPEDVRLDLVAGPKVGPLGDAYAHQLTYPRHRRQALTAILEPNLTVRPPTLIVPALDQTNLRQANMIYGPTQSAVARAIVDALEQGIIPASAFHDELMIVLATVDPRALDRHALHQSVLSAMREAVAAAFGGKQGGKG
ncbi:MAG: 4-hydroxy-tetrahydrodipicolinate synthase [Myxococcales bacterium]|jgi:4-hydroxy-tetrahydrodipicolinate synthase